MTGAEIRERREQMGVTQAQLGAALDVARNMIARGERGELRLENPRMLERALEQWKFQQVLNLKGKFGREIEQRLKKLAEIKAEIQRLIAESQ